MPYEDEEPPFVEPDRELDELAHGVIGAALEVHKKLGAGLDESMYPAAMEVELGLRGIPFVRQALVQVEYKGHPIGERKLDLIVAGAVVVELKAVEQLAPVHKAQLLTYLNITGKKLGLLINFNVPLLREGIKRVIRH